MSTEKKYSSCSLEFWGGMECTINRVHDRYFDQLEISGHYKRANDIALIESLGLKVLRYPILWEKHQPIPSQSIDWAYTTKRIADLDDHGIKPIVGLLHHGSGPVHTNLLDKTFPEKFAAYASLVIKQFPQLEYFTPINEPLTTARFSGLYGLWYPHTTNDMSFVKMMLNQVKGIVLAMKEIRKVNPLAKLIQTEDLSKTYCTSSLTYQAAFENERRWLTYDLLCGKLKPGDLMWDYFRRLGIKETELFFFADNPMPPDIMGFNYYVTSERYLDEHFHKYPSHTFGGNELHEYADLEAIRADHGNPSGLRVLVKEAWERYKLPIAITEAHLNAGREDQLRWIHEIYGSCCELKEQGIDVRAITFWSLFGAFGWNKLLTGEQMDYEPGAFDLRSSTPRKTAIASLIKELTSGNNLSHTVLQNKGWWHQPKRFYNNPETQNNTVVANAPGRPLLIVTTGDPIGMELLKACEDRSIEVVNLGRDAPFLPDQKSMVDFFDLFGPWGVINTTGFRTTEEVVAEQKDFNKNEAELLLSALCRNRRIPFATFSPGTVYYRSKNAGYVESDTITHREPFGSIKASVDEQILQSNPAALIIKTGSVFGPNERNSLVLDILKRLLSGRLFFIPNRQIISPAYLPHLASVSLELFIDEERGIWHLTNDTLKWKEFALKIATKAGLHPCAINTEETDQPPGENPFTCALALKPKQGKLMPSIDHAIECFFNECRILPNSLIESPHNKSFP